MKEYRQHSWQHFFWTTIGLAALMILPAIILFCLENSAQAAGPPKHPILRLETGMHTATIKRIDIDRNQQLLVTGSRDKTVCLWDLASGSLLHTLRLPIDGGDEGKVFAVAISPDGQTVAATGWTGYTWDRSYSIYLFDSSSGQLRERLSGLEKAILDLTFSPDGRWLAAGLGGKKGLRLYHKNGNNWLPAGEDRNYSGGIYGLSFAPITADGAENRLVTSCYDGFLRLYRVDNNGLTLQKKSRAGGGKMPYGVAFSPDGSKIAVGYYNSTAITVHDGKSLAKLYTADTQGVDNGDFFSVAWSADGNFLYGAGMYNDNGMNPICRWNNGGKGKRQELDSGVYDSIMDLLPLTNGSIAYGSADPAWGIIDKNGQQQKIFLPVIADFRNIFYRNNFTLSKNGRELGFAYDYTKDGKEKSEFSMEALNFGSYPSLNPPKTDGIALNNWEDSSSPTLNGKKLPLRQYETSRSRAIAPNGNSFLLGTEWYLRSFTADGKERWRQTVPKDAWAVNISADGRLAVAAFGDGTIRWYRYSDGKLLLSFFPHKDKKRWVAWTPSGYYAASAGGNELIGWHLNNGRDKAADFFPASRFKEQFYRPDVVKKILVTLDEQQALKQANKESNRRHQHIELEKMLPPVISLLSPRTGSSFSAKELTLHYSIAMPSGEPVTGIKAFIDGVEVSLPRAMRRKQKGEGSLTIPMPQRNCEVSLIALNRYGASTPAAVRLQWKGKNNDEALFLPKLYLLAIGVGKYTDSAFNLQFPGKDARDFAQVMQKQQGKIYRDVQVRLLADGDVTRDSVMDGLDWLEKETTSRDVAILFLAGHGINDRNGNYYFLPGDASPSSLRRRGVSYAAIKDMITNLPGKRLMFIDTCFSGNIMGSDKRRGNQLDIAAIANDLAAVENRVVVFTASTGSQYSLENPGWNNGAFTKALVEGLSGRANVNSNPVITVKELDLYISERVKELTGGQQTPTMILPAALPDFPVAVKQ